MNESEDESLKGALALAERVALEAGAFLRAQMYGLSTLSQVLQPHTAEVKSDADREAEDLIREGLCEAFPLWGFRAEEAPELNRSPQGEHTELWLVDPNDGTSAFLKGERGASVSIALIRGGVPVLGVIFAYAAPNDHGDLFTWAKGCGPLRRNQVEITPKWSQNWTRAIFFVSNQADEIAETYKECLTRGGEGEGEGEDRGSARYRVAPGIAYRLALCAAGEGDGALSIAGPRDFDYAAGHALLIGAGGDLIDERGRAVTYQYHHPTRLGFAFGGELTLIKRLVEIDWRPLFIAQRQRELPFSRPSPSKLCGDPDLLERAQGAWWGWHIGVCLYRQWREEGVSSLHSHRWIPPLMLPSITDARRGGDRALIESVRATLSEAEKCGESEELERSIHISNMDDRQFSFLECLSTIQHDLSQGDADVYQDRVIEMVAHLLLNGAAQEDTLKSAQEMLPQLYARLGAQRGRALWPTRLLSELSAFREGPPASWLPDGDRLIEYFWLFVKERLSKTPDHF
jgi:fructose-1,6-bisphosphatase/inositol monophosphatase family enzyme